MPPTLKEVAKAAGVAPSTASGILTGRSDSWASESTRKRVLDAANKLGYRANRFARGLRTGTFQTVGLLVPDLLNPIYTVYARAIERVLEPAGYSLIVEESKADLEGEKQAVRKLLSSQVDGLLCFFMDYQAHYETIMNNKPKSLSMVFFGESYPDSGIDSIMIDLARGTIEAVDELIGLGHNRIGLLHGYHPGPGRGTDARLEFFRYEMAKRDIPLSEENIIVSGPTVEEAYEQFKKYLEQTDPDKRATAVFAINDIIALGVMRAAKDFGLSLPQDLSIIGVDNTPLSHYLPISLTTVSYPIKDISKTATDFLLARMKGDDEPQREVMFSSRLIRRESTAKAPE